MCSALITPDRSNHSAPVVQPIPVATTNTDQTESKSVEQEVTNNKANLKRYAGQSSTLLTNPLGLRDQANVKKKTLLGQ